MPKPPEYCGRTWVMPNSGEKYATALGESPSCSWYQRSSV
jgi:hypothetical protein